MTENIIRKHIEKPEDRIARLNDETRRLNRNIRSLEKRQARVQDKNNLSKQKTMSVKQAISTQTENKTKRLGSYLVSGSFQPVSPRPISDPVRRNRIVFITVVSVLSVFTLIWILSGL